MTRYVVVILETSGRARVASFCHAASAQELTAVARAFGDTVVNLIIRDRNVEVEGP